MKTPARNELYDYIDGTMTEERRIEIEALAAGNPKLRNEINLLRQLQTLLRSDEMLEPVSSRFVRQTMGAILPPAKESFVNVVLKNSSNVFALIMVLSMMIIAFQFFSTPSPRHSSGTLHESVQVFESAYETATNYLSSFTGEYLKPLDSAAANGFGKILFTGIAALLGLGLIDDLIRKKYFH
jgi:hypothetical protein